MSIRLLSILLTVNIFFGSSFADEPVKVNEALVNDSHSGYVLFPYSSCKEATYNEACRKAKLPSSMEGKLLEIKKTAMGLAYFAPSNGRQDDHYELLCYRCALGKVISDDDCGRYKPILRKEAWVKKCPQVP
jgi:hypothetical protein